jgi:hypothetical protein
MKNAVAPPQNGRVKRSKVLILVLDSERAL